MIKFNELERIHLELSTACNAACPACPRNAEGGYTVPWLITRTMSLNDYKKIFSDSVCNQLKEILMCGNYGDPAYCKDLPDILKYTAEKNPNIRIAVHTNGGIRNEEWWANLAKSYENLLVIFSIDGLEDTNHIYRRNVNWQKLMSNVNSFISAGGNAIWEFLIFKHNQHQIEQATQFAKDLNFLEIKFKRAFGFESISSSYKSMRVLNNDGNLDYFIYPPDDENLRNTNQHNEEVDKWSENTSLHSDVYKQALEYKTINFESLHQIEAKEYEKLDNTAISCMTKNNKEIYIDSSGKVHPCCFLGIGSQNVSLAFESMQYHMWLNKNIEKGQSDATLHSLETILESDFLQKIEDTWKLTHANGRMMCCSKMCSLNENPKDKLYV